MNRAIIIDDMERSRAALRADISDYCPEVELVGEAEGVVSGARLIREKNPDIVFLDIQMNDGSGFDLLEILNERTFRVIFTTASNEHAIRAFRFAAVDYLLKPINPDELIQAVRKANQSETGKIDTLKEHLKGRAERLVLNSQDKLRVVEINEVLQCESNGSYTLFYFSNGSQELVTRTLGDFEDMLVPRGFFRVHQSHLVNLSHVREFNKSDGGNLVLSDKSYVPVSSRKRSAVLAALADLGLQP